jgi:chromosome segregation ATPase
VERLYKGALPPKEEAKVEAFRVELEDFMQEMSAVNYLMDQSMDKVSAMQIALTRLDEEKPELVTQLYQLKQKLYEVDEEMNGNRSKSTIGERTQPTVGSRVSVAFRGMNSTYGPTENHRQSFAIGQKDLEGLKTRLESINNEMKGIERSLQAAGAPWIEGQALPKNN